jgi:hypothetical protein
MAKKPIRKGMHPVRAPAKDTPPSGKPHGTREGPNHVSVMRGGR